MRFCTLILFALFLPLTAAELPRGAERALVSYEKAAAKALAEYDKAMADAIAEVVDELSDEMDKATRAGDLDQALAIRSKIEELTPAPEEGADVVGGDVTTPARMLVDNGTEGLKPIHGSLFTNRNYSLTSVPDPIQGWLIAPQAGNAARPQTFHASGPCTIYVLSTDGSLPGLNQIAQTSYTDSGRTPLYLYEVNYKGGIYRTPSAQGFLGAALVVPPGTEAR